LRRFSSVKNFVGFTLPALNEALVPAAFYLYPRDLKSARNIQGAMKEAGDVILSSAKIYAELGEALAGKVRSRANETTIFKSLGMAVEDIAAAMTVYRSVTPKSRSSIQ
jgi:ornithine cyclodeaminase/alanine dehydrogenase-like protein (mu-crystallin family)